MSDERKASTTQVNVMGVQIIPSHVRQRSFVFRPPVTSRPVVRLLPFECNNEAAVHNPHV